MSYVKRYLEELVYTIEYDDLYNMLKPEGWTDEDIDELYDTYRDD